MAYNVLYKLTTKLSLLFLYYILRDVLHHVLHQTLKMVDNNLILFALLSYILVLKDLKSYYL